MWHHMWCVALIQKLQWADQLAQCMQSNTKKEKKGSDPITLTSADHTTQTKMAQLASKQHLSPNEARLGMYTFKGKQFHIQVLSNEER